MRKNCSKKMMSDTFLGVDLSLTSPAVCVFSGDTFDVQSCKFFYLTDKKKFELHIPTSPTVSGDMFPLYNSDQQRYDNIASWVLNLATVNNATHVFIEDYSFGSTGRVFNIAENCGLLKHKLWSNKIPFTTIPPTVIKKYATGKGNSNKEVLQDHFKQKTGLDIKALLGMTDKQWNPSSDIIDSFFICGCGYEAEQIRRLHTTH